MFLVQKTMHLFTLTLSKPNHFGAKPAWRMGHGSIQVASVWAPRISGKLVVFWARHRNFPFIHPEQKGYGNQRTRWMFIV